MSNFNPQFEKIGNILVHNGSISEENLNKALSEQNHTNDKLGNILIANGTIIANGMRKHSAVSFAGYNMPHPLEKTVVIHYKLNGGSLKKVIKDVVGYYNEVYNGIEKKINKF